MWNMVWNPLIRVANCPSILSSSLVKTIRMPFCTLNLLPCLPPSRPEKKVNFLRVMCKGDEHGPLASSSEEERRNPMSLVLEVPQALWRQTLKPLSDFGFGQRSIWEGGVGLFLLSGAVLLALGLVWLRAFQLRSRFRKYLAVFEFDQASGICTGTPVRIRGVTVGNVIRVNPSLKNIEAVAEVEDDKVIIPRNSLVEVNQSGLLMETLIDITPRDPFPSPSAGPLDANVLKKA